MSTRTLKTLNVIGFFMLFWIAPMLLALTVSDNLAISINASAVMSWAFVTFLTRLKSILPLGMTLSCVIYEVILINIY